MGFSSKVWMFTLLLLVSCGGSEVGFPPKDPRFNEELGFYYAKFKPLSLPLTIESCETSTSELIRFDGSSFGKFADSNSYAFGSIPPNGNYYALLTLIPEDCSEPVLTTFATNGIKLDQKKLSLGACKTKCGFTCRRIVHINTDFTLYTADTIKSYTCDSMGYEIPETYVHKVIFQTGKLSRNGKIELSEIQEKIW